MNEIKCVVTICCELCFCKEIPKGKVQIRHKNKREFLSSINKYPKHGELKQYLATDVDKFFFFCMRDAYTNNVFLGGSQFTCELEHREAQYLPEGISLIDILNNKI